MGTEGNRPLIQFFNLYLSETMSTKSSILNIRAPRHFTAAVLLLGMAFISVGCSSSSRQLAKYDFRGARLAIDAPIAPPPSIITNTDEDLWGLTEGTVGSVFRAATAIAKESNAHKARKRMRNAADQVDVSLIIAEELESKVERYLRMQPVSDFDQADFIMALFIDQHGLYMGPSFDGRMAFFMEGQVELIDPLTHRTIWRKDINVEEPVAYNVFFGNIHSAKNLAEMDEQEMIEALERLSAYSADAIMRSLQRDLARARR